MDLFTAAAMSIALAITLTFALAVALAIAVTALFSLLTGAFVFAFLLLFAVPHTFAIPAVALSVGKGYEQAANKYSNRSQYNSFLHGSTPVKISVR
jgi:hypothetical protein